MWKQRLRPVWRRVLLFLTIIGPGLITASADNDAAGIATYSLVGSAYGYKMLWVLTLITFGEVAVQEMGSRIGAVTGKGLSDLIRENFNLKTTLLSMGLLLVANLGTTVAQFAGIAASGELFGVTKYITVPLAAAVVIFSLLRGSYNKVERILIVLSLCAISYVISAFVIRPAPDWGQIGVNLIIPSLPSLTDRQYMMMLLATVGTTITPWGLVYITASVAEKGVPLANYKQTKTDVTLGAVWGNVVSAFIIIATAGTLFQRGVRVESAEQAAMALEPLAGKGAFILFSLGLVGASLLAAFVLPLSSAYALCEAFGWERGVDQPFRSARIFYGVLVGMILVSSVVVLIPGLPLFPLMWLTQAINAILMPFVMVLTLKIVNNRRVMGKWINKPLQNIFIIFLAVFISIATILLFILS